MYWQHLPGNLGAMALGMHYLTHVIQNWNVPEAHDVLMELPQHSGTFQVVRPSRASRKDTLEYLSELNLYTRGTCRT